MPKTLLEIAKQASKNNRKIKIEELDKQHFDLVIAALNGSVALRGVAKALDVKLDSIYPAMYRIIAAGVRSGRITITANR